MKRFIISEEERNLILSLHESKKTSKLLSEATVLDVQNKLIELGYKDMLGKTGADNKFGPNTAAAIMSALTSTSKVSQPASTTPAPSNTPASTTPAPSNTPASTTPAPSNTSASTTQAPSSTPQSGTAPAATTNKKEENTGISSVNSKDDMFDSKTGY